MQTLPLLLYLYKEKKLLQMSAIQMNLNKFPKTHRRKQLLLEAELKKGRKVANLNQEAENKQPRRISKCLPIEKSHLKPKVVMKNQWRVEKKKRLRFRKAVKRRRILADLEDDEVSILA